MNVLANVMNWDPVLWMSLAMVLLAILIFVFLAFKVRSLINRDDRAHRRPD
jgi:hypothetical protein